MENKDVERDLPLSWCPDEQKNGVKDITQEKECTGMCIFLLEYFLKKDLALTAASFLLRCRGKISFYDQDRSVYTVTCLVIMKKKNSKVLPYAPLGCTPE